MILKCVHTCSRSMYIYTNMHIHMISCDISIYTYTIDIDMVAPHEASARIDLDPPIFGAEKLFKPDFF